MRSVKYGETSLIVSIFTEGFGLQSYIINGLRGGGKKQGSRGNPFQPAALLDLVVYHQPQKNIQRIREYRWAQLYTQLYEDVFKASVATFMVELLLKCLKEPESNPDLFYFMEDALLHLDRAGAPVVANYPIFFAVHLANFFGFRLSEEKENGKQFLDLQEGRFLDQPPAHTQYLDPGASAVLSDLLKVMQPAELEDFALTGMVRRQLLFSLESYYAYHLPDFGRLRSLPVLQEVLG